MTQADTTPVQETPLVVYFSRKQDKDGIGNLDRFIESYLKHPAGWPHRLFFIKKGFQKHEAQWQKAVAPLSGIDFDVMEVPDRNYCFGYYRVLLEQYPDRYFMFLTSQSRIVVDNWLVPYMRHARPNRLLSNYGSFHSTLDALNAIDAKHGFSNFSPVRLARLFVFGKELRRSNDLAHFFHGFPALSLRTNAFMVPPGILNKIDWPTVEEIQSKHDEYYFESGKYCLAAQALKVGMELYVVGANGKKYPIEQWKNAETFCQSQRNVIVSDNVTRYFDELREKNKQIFFRKDWGDNAEPDVEKIIREAKPLDLMFYRRCPACRSRGFLVPFHSTPDVNRNISDEVFSYSRCGNCDTISIDKIPEDLGKYYAGNYAPYTVPEDRELTKSFVDLFRRHLPPGKEYLEIGPGAGWIAKGMRKDGFRVCCMEMDEDCCKNLEKTGGIEVIQTSDPADCLARQERKWDAILACHVLEHLADPLTVVRECAERLNPNGVFVLAVPDIWSFAFRLFRGTVRNTLDVPRHLTLITDQFYTQTARECGMRLLEKLRFDPLCERINKAIWDDISACYTNPNTPRSPFIEITRFVYNVHQFWHRYILMNKKHYGTMAGKSTGRYLRKLERLMGKSNAFTLVFRKDEEE